MKIFSLFLVVVFLCHCPGICHAEAEASDDWVTMPAGGKPAYMGIHGGTMPVSLLVSRDGSSLLSFVGVTGDDFLKALHDIFLPLPSFSNSTKQSTAAARSGGLFAGNATATMPVIPFSGNLEGAENSGQDIQYFGLSDIPLVIEGRAAKPRILPQAKKYRQFFLENYFQPKRQ